MAKSRLAVAGPLPIAAPAITSAGTAIHRVICRVIVHRLARNLIVVSSFIIAPHRLSLHRVC
jgi:hypothetical protein